MKLLVSKKTNRKYYWKGEGEYSCKEGSITESDLNSDSNVVKSNKGVEFYLMNTNNYDLSQKIIRGPQIIIPKDLGYICSRTGMDKNFRIIEAGSGSGAATIFFSRIAKEVVSYEVVENHHDIAVKNGTKLGLDNVEFKLGDLSESINDLGEYDLLFLDMPEPVSILEKGVIGLKRGNYIVCYVPSITQVQVISEFAIESESLYLEEISEVILRNWKVGGRVARPDHTKEIDHTAFLVFIRKI